MIFKLKDEIENENERVRKCDMIVMYCSCVRSYDENTKLLVLSNTYSYLCPTFLSFQIYFQLSILLVSFGGQADKKHMKI